MAFARFFTLSLGLLPAAAMLVTTPVPAAAQDNAEARLRRAEAEIRALQRAVFPGGDGRFFEPQISADNQPPVDTATTPAVSTSALSTVLARLDALEGQLQRLTAQTEEDTNRLRQYDERIAALETRMVVPGPAIAPTDEFGAPTSDDTARDAFGDSDADAQEDRPATDSNLAAMTGGASGDDSDQAGEAVAAPIAGPSPERLAAVQAITKPQTSDPGDDEYSYGFRLWDAGFLPEARQQLAAYIEQYPDHSQITYGRNLLGRAFLDDNMPEEAARWFLRNYQADRTARRAPDSLLYLAEAMIAMDDTRRACIALAEFADTYPAVASGRLADQYEGNRRRVTCS
jgi:TolA-binding protein